ncbi:MAG: hypothetical protein DMG71_02180 [Acidobacteria bacterium]|nr:MAG: hypothetical protein DMG71_02180 [Acidobacteriota bacterium]
MRHPRNEGRQQFRGSQLKYETLRRQKDTLRIIFENLPVGVMVADADGKLLFFNAAAEKILGGSATKANPAEWGGAYGWYLPDQNTLLVAEQLPLARAIRGEEFSDELIFVRSPQQPSGVFISVSGRAVRSVMGLTGGVVIFHDATEQQRSLQTNVLLTHDKQGVIQYVNPAFESITGYSREEVLGKTPRILNSGRQDAGFYRQLWSQIVAGRPFQGTFVNRKKTGEPYWVEQTITPIHDEAGNLTYFFSVTHDVTELRKSQEQDMQLRLAREVQQRFYAAPPTMPGFDVAAAAYPAVETGGDYFDFIAMPGGGLAIAVGDVEGHGFGSALVMALTRAYLRSFAAMGLELEQILAQVNRMLVKDLRDGCFVTLILAGLDLQTNALSYASAGHVSGYVLRQSGEVECVLDSTGPPLGLFPESKFFRRPPVTLHPGEVVVLLTDGLTESAAPDGTEFGAERVLQYIRAHREKSAQQLVEGLQQEARAFCANALQDDDITLVVLKVKQEPSR